MDACYTSQDSVTLSTRMENRKVVMCKDFPSPIYSQCGITRRKCAVDVVASGISVGDAGKTW